MFLANTHIREILASCSVCSTSHFGFYRPILVSTMHMLGEGTGNYLLDWGVARSPGPG